MGDPQNRSKNQQINKNRGDRGGRKDHTRLNTPTDAPGASSARGRSTKSGADVSVSQSGGMGGSGTPSGAGSRKR